ncbi:hypothetical protein N7449_004246 [Penicillium cf. viridicatum]|uniref:Uncharacterized protein n=1 Tax=Penicillium cf. viridicatum TaxID=2972119 RepID=A0A9W9MHD3_9EURO|nr:hypothetical protein N7449_006129 [Penicillium cf. viridicatum]KAJ5202167.1 hypothetical protein N7449_004246 [Penicillium cf. viridicatum]
MIEDIDEIVFACCCESVYSSDYSILSPTLNLLGSDTRQPRTEEDPRNLICNIFYPITLPRTYWKSLTRLHERKPLKTRPLIIDIAIRMCLYTTLKLTVLLTIQTRPYYVFCYYTG